MYVDKYFSPEDKKQALDILKNIRTVLKEDINTLSWMTPATREAALKIGFNGRASRVSF